MRLHLTNKTEYHLKPELKKAQQLNNLQLYKIIKVLLMISDGYDREEIAGIMNISVRTVYNRIREFLSGGFGWLCRYRYKGRGCKSGFSEEQKKKLYNIVADGPETCGSDSGVRTSAMTGEVIFSEGNSSPLAA